MNGLCIECQAIARNSEKNRSYQRDWIAKKKKENPEISEILKIKMREKRANPDSGIKKYEKEYRENNKQRERERIYAWRENNKEMVKAAARRRTKENPEKQKSKRHRRRARTIGEYENYNREDVLNTLLSQDGKCVYCGVSIINTYTVDHIFPLSKGGCNCKFNIQCVCLSCNCKKGTKFPYIPTD